MSDWTISDSEELYRICEWSDGYFEINKKGSLVANPSRSEKGTKIDFSKVLEELKDQKVTFPCVLRFHDILRSQVKSLNEVFKETMIEEKYEGNYFGVYPIKVNQMREVVEEIVDAGAPYDYGLEAGSKAELLAALAYNTNKNALTILNGYKDDEYIRLALLGNQLGRKVIIVIEKMSELYRVLDIAEEVGVTPSIGIRCKLSSESCGHWKNSSGDKAKFGLSTAEIVKAISLLKEKGKVNWVKLVHFHLGSQISEIRDIKGAITEATRIYSKLIKSEVPVEYIDVGGGLAVNYDGTNTNSRSSKNYNLKEYVADIVWGIKAICNEEEVSHPNIVSESGRFITATHSLVVANVIGTIEPNIDSVETSSINEENVLIQEAYFIEKLYNKKNDQETCNDILELKEKSIQAFKLGILSLEEKAKIETILYKTQKNIAKNLALDDASSELKDALKEFIAPIYLTNFSVFQSAADCWAIDQILPVVPLSRLAEKPTVHATISDITCDSDGKLYQYVQNGEICPTIDLHPLNEGEDYFIGLFLTGAYQDVMGDMHNLFGRLNEVHVYIDDEDSSGFYIEEIIKGSSMGKVLSTMQYNPEIMAISIKKELEDRQKSGFLSARQAVKLTDFYEETLERYTYLRP